MRVKLKTLLILCLPSSSLFLYSDGVVVYCGVTEAPALTDEPVAPSTELERELFAKIVTVADLLPNLLLFFSFFNRLRLRPTR